MRQILLAFFATLAVTSAMVIIKTTPNDEKTTHLLGAEACTWGPTYWCTNITTAAKCMATHHCIKKVWEGMEVDDDKGDSVCDICKDMVKQARDQLESNQTQEDLKTVFETSCSYMKIKPVVKECDRLVDEFIPELVETLASQMDPSVVCSVSGLCNSPHMDRLIEEHEKKLRHEESGKVPLSLDDDELEPDECSKCYTIASHMEDKFNSASRDDVLKKLLWTCGYMSSFSDACSSIVIKYFSTIYSHMQENFHAPNICHLSGQCSNKFHKHEDSVKDLEVEIRPLSSVGMVEVGDDLPCKLCEQLVGHLRDLLIANTTELEFEKVLEGLCRQTKSFAPECKSIVDEYYQQIYSYLVTGLNSNGVCQMGGICPLPGKAAHNGPIWPLLPEPEREIGVRIMNEGKNVDVNNDGVHKENKKDAINAMQLPIDRMIGPSMILGSPQMDLKGQKTCAFCEYLMHYLQEVITTPSTEDEVKHVMDEVCEKLPKTIKHTCDGFLSQYGDVLIALFAQEIDPSVVCPLIHVCPSEQFLSAFKKIPKDMMIKSEVEEKPSCPLCLLAVGQLYSVIKNDKTEANIEHALEGLCQHLPKNLVEQCDSFVEGYSKELVEMLIADLTPQEICVYIKLCEADGNAGGKNLYKISHDQEIETNEILDYPVSAVKTKGDDVKCIACEFVMEHIEQALKKESTKNEVEKIVHDICNYLPHTVGKQCNNFVNQYADLVIELLSNDVSPQEVCTVLTLCQENMKSFHESVAECALCQAVASTINTSLGDLDDHRPIEEIVSQACNHLAPAKQGKCTMMLEVYEPSIINILKDMSNKEKICSKLALCSSANYFAMMSGHRGMLRNKH